MKTREQKAAGGWKGSRVAWYRRSGALVLIVSFALLTGCDVTNPGNILDEDLSSEPALDALVNGMASDFALALNGANSGTARWTGVLFGELWESTSGSTEVGRGDLPKNRPEFANWTDPLHIARWVAEDGVRRMKEVLGQDAQNSANVAEGLLWAGFSNRILGNTHCRAVFDGGEAEPRRAYYERAEEHFTEAIEVASSAGAEDLRRTAYGGRAQVRLILGNLSGAVSDAQQVPDDFLFEAEYNNVNQGDRQTNTLWHETHPRRNISVAFTWFRDYFVETGDPRVLSADANQPGADGTSPLISVEKYPDGTSDVPLVKGTEMRLIEAEALIRGGDWEAGLQMINDLRAEVEGADLEPWEAANQEEAFNALIKERAIVFWLEARQGGEHYRLNQLTELFPSGYEPADGPFIPRMAENAEASLPEGHQLLTGLKIENRSTCFTFSQTIFNTNTNINPG